MNLRVNWVPLELYLLFCSERVRSSLSATLSKRLCSTLRTRQLEKEPETPFPLNVLLRHRDKSKDIIFTGKLSFYRSTDNKSNFIDIMHEIVYEVRPEVSI